MTRNFWRSERDELKQHSVDSSYDLDRSLTLTKTELRRSNPKLLEPTAFQQFFSSRLLIPRRQYLRCILWIPALLRKDEARLSMAFLFLGYALNRGRVEKTSFTLLLLESCHGIDQQNSGMILPFERTSSVSLSLME